MGTGAESASVLIVRRQCRRRIQFRAQWLRSIRSSV